MAITFVNSKNFFDYSGASSTTMTSGTSVSHTAGNHLTVLVRSAGGVVSGMTDNAGNTFVKAGANGANLEIWYAENIIGNATNVVVVTFAASVAYRDVTVLQHSGVRTSGSLCAFASGTGAGGVATVSCTPTVGEAGEQATVVIADGNAGTLTFTYAPTTFTSAVANTSTNVSRRIDPARVFDGTVSLVATCNNAAPAKGIAAAVFLSAAATGITRVASLTAALGVSGGTSSAINTTGANLIVLSVAYFANITVSDSKGNTWTPLTQRRFTSSNATHQFFYARNPTVGSGHTFTVTGPTTYVGLVVHAYADSAGAPQFESENGVGATTGTSVATGSVTPTTGGSLVVSGLSVGDASNVPTVGSGLASTLSPGVGGTALGCTQAYTVQSTAAAINPTWSWTASTEHAASVAVFAPVISGTLPTANLTCHYDASSADDLFKTFVSGGPHTGTPVDGESVVVWDHEEGADRIFKQSGAIAVPVWRQATPLMPLPCLDFTGGQMLVVTNNAGTNIATSAVISASAFTVLVAFYAESITTAPASQFYNGHPLVGDTGQFWGLFLRLSGGVPKITAYNYDFSTDYVTLDVTPGMAHVAMMRHQGGMLYLSLDGGAESSVASGSTTTLTHPVTVGWTNASAANYDGRLGEIAIYNTALSGSDLPNAISYFTEKWLAGADGRVSQLALETLSLPTPSAGVSQAVLEVLGSTASVAVPGQVTQFVVETLTPLPIPEALATQFVVETLQPVAPVAVRATQLFAEVFVPRVVSTRATQLAVEIFHPRLIAARSTHSVVEYYQGRSAAAFATQMVVEVFRTVVEVPCPVDFPIDADDFPLE